MIVEVPLLAAVLLDVVAWTAWSACVGWWAWRRPVARLATDGRLTRLRPFERDGAFWERRFGVRRWKDRLPEAGDLFPGGYSKRAVQHHDRAGLERFVAETRRAELTHWFIPAATPVFAVWNPLPLFVAMVGYAAVANLPCLVVQRYNRARLLAILARAARRRPSP